MVFLKWRFLSIYAHKTVRKKKKKKDLWEHRRVSPAHYSRATDSTETIKAHVMIMVGLWGFPNGTLSLPAPDPALRDSCSFPAPLQPWDSLPFADISSVPSAPRQATVPRVWACPAYSWSCCGAPGSGSSEMGELFCGPYLAKHRHGEQTAGCQVSPVCSGVQVAERGQCGRNEDTNNGTGRETTKTPFCLAY